METSNFRPEMGRGGGAMNITIMSGMNKFHGEAFDFLRTSALDARNFFDYSYAPRGLPNFVQISESIQGDPPVRGPHSFYRGKCA